MPRVCGIGCGTREPVLERLPGFKSSCTMSIENLNTAVRAAGFAMATSDEATDESKSDNLLQGEAWRPGEAILLSQDDAAVKAAPSIGDRLKGVLGLLGRSAPA